MGTCRRTTLFQARALWFVATREREVGFKHLLNEESFEPGRGMCGPPVDKQGVDTRGEAKPPHMRRPAKSPQGVSARATGLCGNISS